MKANGVEAAPAQLPRVPVEHGGSGCGKERTGVARAFKAVNIERHDARVVVPAEAAGVALPADAARWLGLDDLGDGAGGKIDDACPRESAHPGWL